MVTICSRILVPYDNSDTSKKALKMAMTMAMQDEKIELDVLIVLKDPILLDYPTVYTLTQVQESQRDEAQDMQNDIESQLQTLSNHTRTFVQEGDPAETILDFARENSVDLIVMGSRGLRGMKEMFLGSVSHHVVQKASCPVLIVK
jgi:nucleotide-binding universal stress UspA family protein